MEKIMLLVASVMLIINSLYLLYIGTYILRHNHPSDKEILSVFKTKDKVIEPTEEELRYKTILENIDNFGTSKPQQKVR